MTAVIGYADAMRERTLGPLDERYAEYAQIIGDAGRHMLALAEDLLARARINAPVEAPLVAPGDPGEAVAWALRLMALDAGSAGVSLRLTRMPSHLPMVPDRRAFVQIAVNLVANAIRHTPAGGVISVALAAREAGLVELTVGDTGPGMAPGAHTGGMGLRLVAELVEARGGTMRFADASGGGTCVTIAMPTVEIAP